MHIFKKSLMLAAAALFGTALTFPAHAETISGKLEAADSDSIDGWAWNSDNFNHIVDVELQIIPEGAQEAAKTLTTKADNYREDLHMSIKDGWHGFSCAVDWNTIEGDAFTIIAYVVTEDGRTQLPETITYKKIQLAEPILQAEAATTEAATAKTTTAEAAPAKTTTAKAAPQAPVTSEAAVEYGPGTVDSVQTTGKKGTSVGIFETTGYCSCQSCSNGHNLTYSGTVPQANHTISADITRFPIGTRLMINDIIYTVEDVGSSVHGNKIDIFYATHQEAWDHGINEEEVFLVE